MPTLKAINWLDEALADAESLETEFFSTVDPESYDFVTFQPAIVGIAALIRLLEMNLGRSDDKEEDQEELCQTIVDRAAELRGNLNTFSLSHDELLPTCEHGSERISGFLKANQSLFSPRVEESEEKELEEEKELSSGERSLSRKSE